MKKPAGLFRRNIENIIALASFRGVKTVLATFAFSPLFSAEPRVSSEEYTFALNRNNEVLRAIAREKGVNLFDFAAVFPTEKRFYTDGRHLTEEGFNLKARLFAQYLIDRHLLPEKQPVESE